MVSSTGALRSSPSYTKVVESPRSQEASLLPCLFIETDRGPPGSRGECRFHPLVGMGKVPEEHVQPKISRLPFLEDATVPPVCIMALSFLHHSGGPRLLGHEPIVVGVVVFSGASQCAGRRGTELAGLVLPFSGLPSPTELS